MISKRRLLLMWLLHPTQIFICAAAACLFLAVAETQTTPLPPTFVKASRVGCLAQEITQSDGTMRWIVRVYVDYIDGQRWTKLYAMRDAKDRKKALRDCDDWLKLAGRKIKVPTVLHDSDEDTGGSAYKRSVK